MQHEWEDKQMPIDKPFAACASCGLRDPSLNYHRQDFASLLSLFELNEQDMNDLKAIGSVPFIFRCDSPDRPSYFSKEVDISCIISSANINGTLFHLHPELVTFNADHRLYHHQRQLVNIIAQSRRRVARRERGLPTRHPRPSTMNIISGQGEMGRP